MQAKMQNQIEFKHELKISLNEFVWVFNEFEMSFNRKKSWSQAFSHMWGPIACAQMLWTNRFFQLSS